MATLKPSHSAGYMFAYKPFARFVTGMFTSFTKRVPIPLFPPRSPRKNKGPKPRPNSILPFPVVIDWEKDLETVANKQQMSTNVRTPCTVVLIEIGFLFSLGFG